MSEKLKNKVIEIMEKNNMLVEETINHISTGVERADELRKDLDNSIIDVKKETIKNSVHLITQKIMNDDIDGVIEMLNNNRYVIGIFDFTDALNKLVTTHGLYKVNYDETYPEIKKIKETMLLKEKDLLPLLTEIINEQNEEV